MGEGGRVKDRGAWSQTYLVKELVLREVPDVPRLIRGRKTGSDTEKAWLAVRSTLRALFRSLSAPGAPQPRAASWQVRPVPLGPLCAPGANTGDALPLAGSAGPQGDSGSGAASVGMPQAQFPPMKMKRLYTHEDFFYK